MYIVTCSISALFFNIDEFKRNKRKLIATDILVNIWVEWFSIIQVVQVCWKVNDKMSSDFLISELLE